MAYLWLAIATNGFVPPQADPQSVDPFDEAGCAMNGRRPTFSARCGRAWRW